MAPRKCCLRGSQEQWPEVDDSRDIGICVEVAATLLWSQLGVLISARNVTADRPAAVFSWKCNCDVTHPAETDKSNELTRPSHFRSS
ncbi:hypothetical protein E2C01_100995 [Portunus trituberculatus]|uniref:Uncharacterized protein n=1 Tax=Portunus trituberculatus TaxID=210409 RepID=A0A5B7K9H2_PORTR|nr:hypothetical protein [Portunus trituberculatus]